MAASAILFAHLRLVLGSQDRIRIKEAKLLTDDVGVLGETDNIVIFTVAGQGQAHEDQSRHGTHRIAVSVLNLETVGLIPEWRDVF